MTRQYDAVVASTGPSLEIDRRRASRAMSKIIETYGNLEDYKGLWVVAGTLGGQKYETSQRKRILDQFLDAGIKEEQIRVIGGEDTMGKVREIIGLSETEELNTVGISTYLLHFLRYQQGLHFAKKEDLAPNDLEFKLIWSPTPTMRLHKDLVYGLTGLGIETIRLMKNGFLGATSSHKTFGRHYSPIKSWASEDGEETPLE
jgi:hypothetical protein